MSLGSTYKYMCRKSEREINALRRAGVPALTTHKVALVAGPRDAVLATRTVRVCYVACAVCPERVVEPVVGTSLAGSTRASGEGSVDGFKVEGEGKGGAYRGDRDKQ